MPRLHVFPPLFHHLERPSKRRALPPAMAAIVA
jgi:hypothetical protein